MSTDDETAFPMIQWCPQCGRNPRIDEDGCCAACGTTTGEIPDPDETARLRAELAEAKSECKVGAHMLAQTGDKLRAVELDLTAEKREAVRMHARVAELQSELRRAQDLYDEEILPELDAARDGEACALQALAEQGHAFVPCANMQICTRCGMRSDPVTPKPCAVRLAELLADARICSICGGDPASHPSGLPCVCGDGTQEGEVRGLQLRAVDAERQKETIRALLAKRGDDFAAGLIAATARAEAAEKALAEAIISRDAAEREADRWRHGVPIEGDYVCPESLRADAVEKQLFDMRAALGVAPEPAPAPVTLDQVVVDAIAAVRCALGGKEPSDG